MRKYITALLFSILFTGNVWAGELRIYFSPSPRCEQNLVELINNSKQRIDAAVYAINNDEIVEALKNAHRRGVKIRILTDRLQASNKSSKVRELYNYGINIRVHSKHKIEHNKFAVFDNKSAASGSYNWTNPASEKNSENCIFFVQDQEAAGTYCSRFDYLWKVNTKKKSDKWFERKKG